MQDFLKDDYNLDALTLVQPEGDAFSMYATPRFVPAYARNFEALSTRVVKKRLSRCDLFVDVGAHYGYYTLMAAEANRGIRIVAIEPVAENFSVLQANLRHNGIGNEQVTCIRAAASSKKGGLLFCKSEASDNGSVVPHPASETIARVEIESVRLDDVINKESARSVFVKMDTDGHELEVLRGLAGTLDDMADVTVMLEMNPKMMRIAGTSAEEIIGLLRGKGFRLFAIDDREARFYPLEMTENLAMMQSRYETSFYNVLCVKKAQAMSVLFFSHSTGLTGAERSLLDLIDGLCARGVVCSAVLPGKGPVRRELIALGCGVYLPDGGEVQRCGWWWAASGGGSPKHALADTCEVVADTILPEIRKTSPDVIFSQTIVSPWGAACAEALGIPHVLSAREYGVQDHGFSFALGFKPSVRALYESSEAVFCTTRGVRDALFGDDKDARTEIVYGHVRIAPVGDDDVSTAPDAASEQVPSIGIFASIVAGKGQEDLVRACIALLGKGRKMRCVLAGAIADESYAATLKQLIATSGYAESFLWTGFMSDPHAQMRKMDVIVSCSRKEALGRTLIEASILGRPIIFAKSGGPDELFVHGEHGLAYEPGDHNGLANDIESVLSDKAAAGIRAQRAREYVSRIFSEEAYAGTIYSRLCEISRRQGRTQAHCAPVGRLLMEAGIAMPSPGVTRPKMFYSDHADSFCECQTVLADETTFGPFDITFDFPGSGCSCLRFDPTETHAVTLWIHDLIARAEDGTAIEHSRIGIAANGEPLPGPRAWEFLTRDPQVTLLMGTKAKHVRIIGELKKIPVARLLAEHDRIVALRVRDARLAGQQQIDQLTSELARTISERDAAREHVVVLLNSKSWHLTAPLRAVSRMIFGA